MMHPCMCMCVKERRKEIHIKRHLRILTVFCVCVNFVMFLMSLHFAFTFKLAPSPSCLLHRLTCCCWKDLSLFLKRDGRTKSHPLARKASSPLRSGSRRNDVSLIIMVGAETCNPPPDTATGAATDTAATDGPAHPATKQPVKGKRLDCNSPLNNLDIQLPKKKKKVTHFRKVEEYPACV